MNPAKLINWQLLGNPYNWIVVTLMVAIFAFAWGLVDPLRTSNDTQGSPP